MHSINRNAIVHTHLVVVKRMQNCALCVLRSTSLYSVFIARYNTESNYEVRTVILTAILSVVASSVLFQLVGMPYRMTKSPLLLINIDVDYITYLKISPEA